MPTSSAGRHEALQALESGARLALLPERQELDRLMRWVLALLESAGIGETTCSAVQICIDEAFANVLEHGSKLGGASAVDVTMTTADGTLTVIIADDGEAFDPLSVAPPRQAKDLDDAQIGGLGIHFMRSFSSSMHYARADGRNHLTLTFPLDPPAKP